MGRLYASLIGLGIIWGTSFLFIKILLKTLDPAEVVFGRTFFGAAMLLVIAFAAKKSMRNFRKLPHAKLIGIALANNILPWLLISAGETKITSSLASIINATTPIWTLLIGFLFFSARLRKNQWAGAFIGFCGIFILSDFGSEAFGRSNLAGILMMSGAALCYGIGSQLTKKFANDIPIFELSLYTLAFSSAASFIAMLATGLPEPSVFFSLANIGAFLGLGAIGSGIAYLIYYFLVQKGSPEFAALVTYLAPVFAIIWGAFLLEEQIHLSMLAGLGLIFFGVFISSLKKKALSAIRAIHGDN
ncbi:EamA/RhaT family transporter [Neobacillus piezotolerans]|uniref:EamA/RhaT family transporter n=1 Tax=Neobacillus piezotolerans TaxID=2259171 RepID=A0A3D8GWI4_9BACI|nr:DMT family transporter [Neobacillus piezotolerans]RDU38416.1 EamA/RhaT family transporter [Neobacillus piezotolerans]